MVVDIFDEKVNVEVSRKQSVGNVFHGATVLGKKLLA